MFDLGPFQILEDRLRQDKKSIVIILILEKTQHAIFNGYASFHYFPS